MCKVLMLAGIKKQHQEKARKLASEFVKIAGRIDDDGFGYAAITKDGKIYGEKWVNKEDAFVIHSQPKTGMLVKELLGEAVKVKDEDKIYESFGVTRTKEALNNTVALLVHARKKTHGVKSIENCHPFFEAETKNDPDTALIHNGSIINHYNLTKKTSTCDSEVILHEYLNEAMSYNPWAIDKLAKTLSGQYTVGVLTSTTHENGAPCPVMDIFKSNKELQCAYIKELETFAFCTTSYVLEESCKAAGLTAVGMEEVKDGYLIRLDAITGEKWGDIIPFELSRQYTASTTITDTTRDNHHRPNRADIVQNLAAFRAKQANKVRPDVDETIADAKMNFERNHGDLFTSTYYDLSAGLTEEETAYYKTLEADNNIDLKALRLVKKIMGSDRA